MKREFINVGMKVVPHSKAYGGLDNSSIWQSAKSKNQPYLFVSRIQSDKIILNDDIDDEFGDFFLPEDFEPYIEESESVKMKKSQLNSSMLFKMRDGDLCALLSDSEDNMIFNNKEDIKQGYSSYFITLNDYDEELSSEGDDYDIVAIKQYDSCMRVVHCILEGEEPEEWNWVEEVEKDVEEPKIKNTVQNITINITVDPNMNINDFMKELSSKWKNISNY